MGLRLDSEKPVPIANMQWYDGSVEHTRMHRVLFISTQHAEPLKTVQNKEVARYSGLEEDWPSMEGLTTLIETVIRKTPEEIIIKNVLTAWTQGSIDETTSKCFTTCSHWINEYNACVTRLSLRTTDQGDAAHEPLVKVRREPCTEVKHNRRRP